MSTPNASIKAITDALEPVVQKYATATNAKVDELNALLIKLVTELTVQVSALSNEISDLKKDFAARGKTKPAAGATQADGTTAPAAKPFPATRAAAFNFLYETDEAFRLEFSDAEISAKFDKMEKKPKDYLKKIAKETFAAMTEAKTKHLPNKMDAFDKIYNERRSSKGAPTATNLELDKDE